jgi:hypothetical protein
MNKKHENQYLGTGFRETIDVNGLKKPEHQSYLETGYGKLTNF